MKYGYAECIINISHESVDRTYSYRIPEQWAERIKPGTAVKVPFGRGSTLRDAYVVELRQKPTYEGIDIKYIYSIQDKKESVESKQLSLAFFMHQRYGTTMARCLSTVLPVKTKIREKTEKTLRLAVDKKKAEEIYYTYINKKSHSKAAVLKRLIEKGTYSVPLLIKETGAGMDSVKRVIADGCAVLEENRINRIQISPAKEENRNVRLNDRQQQTVDEIWDAYSLGKRKPSLIYGVTGSGKTEVYMELISRIIDTGKQAIVLIPEISLTYQTVARFCKKFGNKVSILNSKMSDGERFDQIERAKSNEISIMIGPRSALFTPFENLGLVIIDEEHEPAYKNEQQPRYQTRDVAEKLCSLYDAMLVMGSATPSLESYSRAQNGRYDLYRLDKRAGNANLAEVSIEDMRKELEEGNMSIFSRNLRIKIEETLKRKEQIMLFINRRGYAGFVSCRSCGKPINCPHCDVSLTYHNNDASLRCHYCGYKRAMVKLCPSCGSKYIGGFKAGTQAITRQIEKAYPQARVLRMDYDTTKNKNGHENILAEFAAGKADILVGTQMIVKGHDFPNVTLMGILAADSSLFVSDFRAAERTFQLLTQAAGRAGRSQKPGEVIIQTYQPEHYAVVQAAHQNYDAFYREEMQYRKLLRYPPAAHILVIMVADKEKTYSIELAASIKKSIDKIKDRDTVVLGPSPAGIEKLQDYFRQMLYIKDTSEQLLEGIRDSIDEEYKNIKRSCIIQMDIDPQQLQ